MTNGAVFVYLAHENLQVVQLCLIYLMRVSPAVVEVTSCQVCQGVSILHAIYIRHGDEVEVHRPLHHVEVQGLQQEVHHAFHDEGTADVLSPQTSNDKHRLMPVVRSEDHPA